MTVSTVFNFCCCVQQKWRTNVLGAQTSKAIKFMNKVEGMHRSRPRWELPDLVLGAIALQPELITQSALVSAIPVVEGVARGSLDVDYYARTNKRKNVIIVGAFDVEGFKQMLLQAFA